jgi:hypothetical protein
MAAIRHALDECLRPLVAAAARLATLQFAFGPNGRAQEGAKGLHRLRPEQGLVVRFDRPVAFADRFLQSFNIGDLYMAP